MDDFGQYENVISLGYFCSVAKGLERMGLRSASYPFDWCISEFDGLIKMISNRFENFMEFDNLAQSSEYKNHYMDTVKCTPLSRQIFFNFKLDFGGVIEAQSTPSLPSLGYPLSVDI